MRFFIVTLLVVALLLATISTIVIVQAANANENNNNKPKIDTVVVLEMENRAFDELLGYSKQLGIKTLTGDEFNPLSTTDKNSPKIYVNRNAPYTSPLDPDHATYAYVDKIYGAKGIEEALKTGVWKEKMDGFVEYEMFKHKKQIEEGKMSNQSVFTAVMSCFTPEKLPILNQLAGEFAVFEEFYQAVPGSTWPNREFSLAATSQGNTETFFWNWQQVNHSSYGQGHMFTTPTFLDQLIDDANMTAWYVYDDTVWENFYESLSKKPEIFKNMDDFRAAAATGTLPSFTYMNPRAAIDMSAAGRREHFGSNDMHPDHDVRLSEMLYRDVYQMVRNSPKWNSTLFVLTFDEGGGHWDSKNPPSEGVPAPDDSKAFPDVYFNFERLGPRVVNIAISPLIKKGTVVGRAPAAQNPTPTSQYDQTSIMSTVRKLFNIDQLVGPLTKRDAWSSTFEHIFGDEIRTDCPTELVPARKPHYSSAELEMKSPLSHLQRDIAKILHQRTDGAPTRTTAHPDTIKKQGELGSWLKETWQHHLKLMHLHKKHDKRAAEKYSLVVGTAVDPIWAFGDVKWDINYATACGLPNRSTISTRTWKIKELGDVPYCLEADFKNNTVHIAPCHYTQDPCKNTRHQQFWHFGVGSGSELYSIRPESNLNLALTTEMKVHPAKKPTLQPYKATISQSFGYMGSAVANSNLGTIMNGDGVNILGVKVNF